MLMNKELKCINKKLRNIKYFPDKDGDLSFAFSDFLGSKNTKFFFYGKSEIDSDKPLLFEWDFGNGQTKIGQNVWTKYSKEGIYEVKLNLSDGIDKAQDSIIIKIGK